MAQLKQLLKELKEYLKNRIMISQILYYVIETVQNLISLTSTVIVISIHLLQHLKSKLVKPNFVAVKKENKLSKNITIKRLNVYQN